MAAGMALAPERAGPEIAFGLALPIDDWETRLASGAAPFAQAEVTQENVPKGTLSDTRFPGDVVPLLCTRSGRTERVRGSTRFRSGDRATLLSAPEGVEEVGLTLRAAPTPPAWSSVAPPAILVATQNICSSCGGVAALDRRKEGPMVRWLTILAVLGGEAAALPQESRGAPCKAGRIGFGFHCDMCRRTLAEVDMRGGLCKRCDERPRKIEYCVKRLKPVFYSTCVHKKKMELPFRCCGQVFRVPRYTEDRARVSYACRACGAKADTRADLQHLDSCDNAFAVDLSCAKSGIAPHVK